MTVQATEQAAAAADQAHGGVAHGDNAPARTEALRIDRAVVDRIVPPLPPPAAALPMCWSWGGRT
jgi:hypothetical protein